MAANPGTPHRVSGGELRSATGSGGSPTGSRGTAGVRIRSTRAEPMPTNLRDVLAVGLFVLLAGYVSFSAIRLGLLLWQRFA